MKKILSSIAAFFLVVSIYAENEVKKKSLKIESNLGVYSIQEPISHALFTSRNLFLLKNEEKKSALYRISGNSCIELTAERVKINHEQRQNPLSSSSVSFMALGREESLYIAMDENPATLYMFTSLSSQDIRFLAARDIHDAEGKTSAGIVGLASGVVADGKVFAPYTLVAVKKHDGHFGEPGSGIAVVRYDADIKEKDDKKNKEKDKKEDEDEEEDKKKKEESRPFFDILDSTTGISHGNKATALESGNALSIHDGLGSIAYDVVDIHWSEKLSRCYIALCAKTKEGINDTQGVCALLVGRVENRKLSLEPVVDHNALCGHSAIVGATGSNRSISLHKVITMSLINGLNYVVVVGGNGEAYDVKDKVYAFPLVNTHYAKNKVEPDKKFHGTIAKKGSIPCVKAHNNGSVLARVFEDGITNKEEFYTATDACVQVGGSHLLPGPIQDITANGDSIIVSVLEDGNGMAAGVFYSQAILNEHGAVAAWSGWQRVPGGDKKTIKTISQIGEFRFLYRAGAEQFLHVRSTGWYTTQNLSDKITLALDPVQACITAQYVPGNFCSIADYPVTLEGVSSKEDPISMLVGVGKEKVLMLQTSKRDEHGIVRPHYESYSTIFETDTGSLKSFSKAKNQSLQVLSITGGDLTRCGLLSSSAIGTQGEHAWLFVGGSGGLAVLSRKNGSGWNAKTGLQNGFKALHDDFAFKMLGNYSFIRKLVCCNGYLYVLTYKGLDRIALNPEQCKTSQPQIEHLIPESAYKSGKKVFYNDIIISPDLILVATSEGLLYGHPEECLSLKKVNLPELDQSAIGLSVVSASGHEQDFAYKGQVYAVTRSANYKLTYVYRLFVDVSQENPVQVVYDCYQKDEKKHWVRYVPHQQRFVTDGISLYSYCSRGNQQPAKVSLIPLHDVRGSNIIKGTQIVQLPLMLEDAQNICTMIRNSATGSWLVAGDFGLRVNM